MSRRAMSETDRPKLGRVRIIAGSCKGRRFDAPPGTKTRPTSDFVRETAFNLIGPVDGAAVLDLFAGSGGLGLEALSRGAGRCVFVDSDRSACRTIGANLEKLGFTATVLCQDAPRSLASERRAFDLILCDPPYDFQPHDRLAPDLARILSPDGLIVYQTAAAAEPELAGLSIRTSRKYGSARLTLFEL
jgi:16S rRNA (guanine966-N2)-methyltransferase